jgi:hypothetical protein
MHGLNKQHECVNLVHCILYIGRVCIKLISCKCARRPSHFIITLTEFALLTIKQRSNNCSFTQGNSAYPKSALPQGSQTMFKASQSRFNVSQVFSDTHFRLIIPWFPFPVPQFIFSFFRDTQPQCHFPFLSPSLVSAA